VNDSSYVSTFNEQDNGDYEVSMTDATGDDDQLSLHGDFWRCLIESARSTSGIGECESRSRGGKRVEEFTELSPRAIATLPRMAAVQRGL
jgi:hypothetical protein